MSAGTWSRSTWTAKPLRPSASSVSADARPNWIVTIGGVARSRGALVGGVADAAVLIGHDHAEARLVELEAEAGRLLAADPGPERVAGGAREGHRIEPVGELAELDEAVRPEDRPRHAVLAGRLAPWQRTEGADRPVDLGDDVVVVRVEPLRHLPRLALAACRGRARSGRRRHRSAGHRPRPARSRASARSRAPRRRGSSRQRRSRWRRAARRGAPGAARRCGRRRHRAPSVPTRPSRAPT